MSNQARPATERRALSSRSHAIDWATRIWIALFAGGVICLLAHMLR